MTLVTSKRGRLDTEFRGDLQQMMGASGTMAPVTFTMGLFTAVIKSAAGDTIRNLEDEIRRRVAGDSVRVRELEDKVIKQANRIIDLENENLGLKEEISMMMKEMQLTQRSPSRTGTYERWMRPKVSSVASCGPGD